MSSLYLVFAVCSLLCGGVCFITTNNIICGCAVLLICLSYFFFIAQSMIKKYLLKMKRLNSCYDFINTFILSLSTQDSISYSYKVSFLMLDKDVKELMKTVSNQNDKENLLYLEKNIFSFDIYKLFLNVLSIWETQGGDILNMSKHLISETRSLIERHNTIKNNARKNVFEFGILWFITLVILVILRFSLVNFYDKIINQPIFLVCVVFVFIFMILSIHIFISRIVKIKIRGWNDNDKHY